MQNFYDMNATQFFADTVNADMTLLYKKFLPLILPRGHLLDCGCGSGRDTKFFLGAGYRVTAIDDSKQMADMASEHCGIAVRQLRMQDIDYQNEFDGIWASASLLHVARSEMTATIRLLLLSLKPQGVLYASFKNGSGDRVKDGRQFTDFTAEQLIKTTNEIDHCQIVDVWESTDVRPEREHDSWSNILLRRF